MMILKDTWIIYFLKNNKLYPYHVGKVSNNSIWCFVRLRNYKNIKKRKILIQTRLNMLFTPKLPE